MLLLCVIIFNFLLIHLAPGDAVQIIVGEMGGATPEIIDQIKHEYGLDKSLPAQIVTYFRKIMRGDLGYSFYFNQPVSTIILDRLPATLLLMMTAMTMAVLLGTFLGVTAARKPNGWFSHFVTVLSLTGYSAPVFWTGMVLLIIFSYYIPIFPSYGMAELGFKGSFVEVVVDTLWHLVLPSITLASIYLAYYSRIARASMLDVLGSDYIRTARAKGLAESTVIFGHALKNAILPVVTLAGLQFRTLIAGAVVVETVFSWPGMGLLVFESILRRDHPLLLGILLLSAVVVILANLLTDLTYRLLDPRIK